MFRIFEFRELGKTGEEARQKQMVLAKDRMEFYYPVAKVSSKSSNYILTVSNNSENIELKVTDALFTELANHNLLAVGGNIFYGLVHDGILIDVTVIKI